MSSVLEKIMLEYLETIKDNPDALGEILRAWAFPGEGYGCYSTFDLRPEFIKFEVSPREFNFLWGRPFDPNDTDESDWGYCDAEAIKRISWYKHPNGIEVGWYWDGDGNLAFYIPELKKIIGNSDCKCSYNWDVMDE